MTPEQFLDRLSKKGSESVYLFLGPESYNRERCRRALIEAALDPALPPEEREAGFARHDLDQVPLASALDDARSLSKCRRTTSGQDCCRASRPDS